MSSSDNNININNRFFQVPLYSINLDPKNYLPKDDRSCSNLTISQIMEGKQIRLVERNYFLHKYYYKFRQIEYQEYDLLSLRISETMNVYRNAMDQTLTNIRDPRLPAKQRSDAQFSYLALETNCNILVQLDTAFRGDMAMFYKKRLPTYDIFVSKIEISALYNIVEMLKIVGELENKSVTHTRILLSKLSYFFDPWISYIPEMEMM